MLGVRLCFLLLFWFVFFSLIFTWLRFGLAKYAFFAWNSVFSYIFEIVLGEINFGFEQPSSVTSLEHCGNFHANNPIQNSIANRKGKKTIGSFSKLNQNVFGNSIIHAICSLIFSGDLFFQNWIKWNAKEYPTKLAGVKNASNQNERREWH